MWNYEDKENLIENITVRYHYKNKEHTQIQLIAHKNYVLKLKDDNGFIDEDNNYYPPIYSKTIFGGTWLDINTYEAILENEIERNE